MKLYHYTSMLHVSPIRNSGELSQGDIPLRQSLNYGESGHAVWLTTRDFARRNQHGLISPVCDKSEIRFTIELPGRDPKLFKWSEYAKLKRVSKKWYDTLDEVGCGLSDTWWLYLEPISIEGLEVAIKRNGKYEPIDISRIPLVPVMQFTELDKIIVTSLI